MDSIFDALGIPKLLTASLVFIAVTLDKAFLKFARGTCNRSLCASVRANKQQVLSQS